jgi:hypothetical protein
MIRLVIKTAAIGGARGGFCCCQRIGAEMPSRSAR